MATNPALRMLGLASGASVGGYAMIRDYVTLAVLAALMSTLAVVRHTRQNEELGRAEMRRCHGWSDGTPSWPPPSSSRSWRTSSCARRSASPWSPTVSRAAGCARRRCVRRGRRPGLRRRRGGDLPARRRPPVAPSGWRRGPRRGVPAQRHRQHARHRRLRRPHRHQRLAGVALPDRLGSADAAVRRGPVVAARARSFWPLRRPGAGRLRARRPPRRRAGLWPDGARGRGTRAGPCSAPRAWSGACSGAPCSAGRSGCSGSAWSSER